MIQQHKAKTTIIYKSKPHQYHNTTSIQQIHSKTKATMCIPTFGRRINISIHDSDSSRPPLSFSRIVTVRHNRCGPPWHRLPPCIVEGQRVISRHRAAETQMKNRTFRRIEWKSKLKHKHLRRNTNNYNGTLVEQHFRSCTYLDPPGVKAGVHASVTCSCWGKGAVPYRGWRDAVQNMVEHLRVQSKINTIIASKKTSVFFWYGFRIFLVDFRNKVVFQ